MAGGTKSFQAAFQFALKHYTHVTKQCIEFHSITVRWRWSPCNWWAPMLSNEQKRLHALCHSMHCIRLCAFYRSCWSEQATSWWETNLIMLYCTVVCSECLPFIRGRSSIHSTSIIWADRAKNPIGKMEHNAFSSCSGMIRVNDPPC